jgi:serine/threonine-protein kinase
MAYTSNESGTPEVYVRPFPGPGGKWQISTGGGTFPLWSRSGRELLFERPLGNGIMVVSYTTKGEAFSAGTPKVWSAANLVTTTVFPNYDLAPDGKRIAVLLPEDDAEGSKPPTHVILLLNFFDELRRKAPVKN